MKTFLSDIRGSIDAPAFIFSNTFLLAYSGSRAYGIQSIGSDIDLVGCCIPPQEYLFPESYGYIRGFGDQPPVFNDYHNTNIQYGSPAKQYDLRVYGIVHFFELARKGNPQVLEAIFTPTADQIFCNKIGQLILANREIFLSKALFAPFTGYAYSQKSQIEKLASGKRKELVDNYGYDTKAAAHAMRLLSEAEYIFQNGTLDIKHLADFHTSIRNGHFTLDMFYSHFDTQYERVKELYSQSTLPEKSDQNAIRQLLLDCINMQYATGKAAKAFDKHQIATDKIRVILDDLYQ